MTIRPLTTLDDCRQVADLEKTVWGYTDAEDVVPPPVLIVSIKRGGILLGAFDDAGEMTGFVYSIPGIKDGKPMQWSHMLGVMLASARSTGLGTQLKLAQREATLAMGLDLIEWTYDPLQAMNAHLNFAKSGRRRRRVRGEHLRHVEQSAARRHADRSLRGGVAPARTACGAPDRRECRSSSVMERWRPPRSSILRATAAAGSNPATRTSTSTHAACCVEIPIGFTEMMSDAPDLALEWRMSTRPIFQTLLRRGYRAVDFFLSREARRGQYLLA